MTTELPETTVSIAESSYRNRPIPPALGERLATAYDLSDRPKTLGEWVDAFRRSAQTAFDWPLNVDDLCIADDSRHEATVDGETIQFHCDLDALFVPFLTDQPVQVRSQTPIAGEQVVADVDRETMTYAPPDAVLSLGAGEAATDGFDPAVAYEQLCTYVNAFASREAYERWDETVPEAATMAVPLSAGFGMASEMVADA